MVSVMITSITMIIETIAATWKVGAPKWNGVEIANPWASLTPGEVELAHEGRDDGAGDQADRGSRSGRRSRAGTGR